MESATTLAPGAAGMFSRDFDALEIGDRFDGPACELRARDVAVFAALTGDGHPAHTDPEWAASGPFGERIAHGLLVLSCAVGTLPLDPERVIALRRLRDVVFKRPVAVGEEIVAACEVRELRPVSAAEGLVGCEWRISGGDGRLRVRALVELLWRRGEPDGGRPDAAERRRRGEPDGGRPDRAERPRPAAELSPIGARPDGSTEVLV